MVETESGLLVPAWSVPESRPAGIDLFCGAGGCSLGFIAAGFRVVAGVEKDHAAALNYGVNLCSYPCDIVGIEDGDREAFSDYIEKDAKRSARKTGIMQVPVCGSGWLAGHPEAPGVPHLFIGDICKLTGDRILERIGMKRGELACVFGGPPCQGFSLSNSKRSPGDPRNLLVFEFVRLVLELQPKTMVMENVPAMIHMKTPWGTPVIDEITARLEAGGWAEAEAIKNSLLGNTKAGAAYRVTKTAKRKRPTPKQKPKNQRSLF